MTARFFAGFLERMLLRFSIRRRVIRLVRLAHSAAVGRLDPFVEKWPFLDSAAVYSAWNLLVTVALVHFAMTVLRGSLTEQPWRLVFHTATECLDNIDSLTSEAIARALHISRQATPQPRRSRPGGEALLDCQRFCGERLEAALDAAVSDEEKQLVFSDLHGMWVMWNLLGRAPDGDEELLATRAVGLLCAQGADLAKVVDPRNERTRQ